MEDDFGGTKRFAVHYRSPGGRGFVVDAQKVGNEMRYINSCWGEKRVKCNVEFRVCKGPNGIYASFWKADPFPNFEMS